MLSPLLNQAYCRSGPSGACFRPECDCYLSETAREQWEQECREAFEFYAEWYGWTRAASNETD